MFSAAQSQANMDVDKNFTKLKLLFDNVLEGKCVINEHNMERLLEYLKDRSIDSQGNLILKTPAFIELLFHLIDKIDDASDSFKVFLIKIVTIYYENYGMQQFTSIQVECLQNLFTRICVPDNLSSKLSHNLHLAFIKLATAQIHSELDFIMKNNVWKMIFYPTIHHKPREISKATYNFMAKLVWKLNDHNFELELQEVLGYIVTPILSNEYLDLPVLDATTDIALADEIFPYLSSFFAILVEGDNHTMQVNKISTLLKEYFVIDHRLFFTFRNTKNPHLIKLFNDSIFRYILMCHRHLLFSNRKDEFCNMMTTFHRNYVTQSSQKKDAFIIVDYVTQSTITWSNFEKLNASRISLPLTFEKNGETLEFSLQIFIHLIMPMVKYVAMYRIDNKMVIDDEVDLYIRKTAKSLTDYIFASCYVFADLLEENDELSRKKLIIYTLKQLLRLKGHISQAQAGTLFQSLFYLLEMFTARDGPDVVVNENPMDADDLIMLSHLLNAMEMVLKEHNLPWYEYVEVVCVQSSLLNLLKQSILTTKHVVQVLELIKICIKKFLPPNMSLLVESKNTQDSTLSVMGKVLTFYSQHEDWELRDSAFNVLISCTEVSFIKYICMQPILRRNNLMGLAAKAGLTDPQFYSQCTALKCLAAATKVEGLWQEVLVDNPDINLHLIYMIKNHSEGMVRKEAANVLIAMYVNKKLTAYFQNTLYEVMQSAALDDLHWEVQLAALQFWKYDIQNHLTDRGMLDGKFPTVTFSKEKRKIIILNEPEIKRQLAAIMYHLSIIGCLTVLLECMNETQHIQVIDEAYSIAKDIIKILDKYNFNKLEEHIDIVKTESADVSPKYEPQYTELYSATNEEKQNKVIESILSTDDVELLANLNDKQNDLKSEIMDIDLSYSPRRKLLSANEFLENLRSNNYPLIIQRRKNSKSDYVCTLDQLLDEVLDIVC